MAEISSTEFKTKTGLRVIIRSAKKEDAVRILKLSESVIAEEIYQLT